MNPEAPKAQQVRRVVLWCALFSIGLFCSLLLLIVVDTAENSRGRSPANLSDAQLVEQVGLSQLSKSQRIGALDEIGRRRLSALKNTPLLFDGPEIAIAFAKAAAQVGDVALVPALMKQLDDSDATVRSSSTQALGILGDKRTAEFLKVRAARETNPAVREKMKAAIEALGN